MLKLDMIMVEEGDFFMGANHAVDPEAEYEEKPQRKVWLSSYKIQKTPVTFGQWKHFLRQTGYRWDFQDEASKTSPSEEHPITQVSWLDCSMFVQWLTLTLREEYKLPTEAQWEKACRGNYGQLYPWGNEKPDWVKEMSAYLDGNLAVGSRSQMQSPHGCLDMWQNVSEWCSDWYDGDYYHDNPEKITNPCGPESGEFNVFRGGCPLSSGWPRCSFRGFQKPEFRHERIGFRVVLNI